MKRRAARPITEEERTRIIAMRKRGDSYKEIASATARDTSVISKVLRKAGMIHGHKHSRSVTTITPRVTEPEAKAANVRITEEQQRREMVMMTVAELISAMSNKIKDLERQRKELSETSVSQVKRIAELEEELGKRELSPEAVEALRILELGAFKSKS